MYTSTEEKKIFPLLVQNMSTSSTNQNETSHFIFLTRK